MHASKKKKSALIVHSVGTDVNIQINDTRFCLGVMRGHIYANPHISHLFLTSSDIVYTTHRNPNNS
jgi:hypothetical protein